MTLGLGIDTGGTYTDTVVADIETGVIISRSKALTTRDNLVKGIVNSLRGLSTLEGISMVSLSSTLATNSVVEGKCCRVGLINIGKRSKNTVHTEKYAFVGGEYDLRGNVVHELDIDAARDALNEFKGNIDVLAVAGYLSVRYPMHENAVRDLSNEILGVPVVCAHELTSKLGFDPRANTAVINAGLIPVTMELIKAVRASLTDMGVDAPLMIVRGDGSLMNVETALQRPIETIMSGPASSLTSAMLETGSSDALVVDIGGTTTDIGLIKGGFIHTLDSGAKIGGHRTRVRAADLSTFGIGGDSHIAVKDGKICLTSVRYIPLCVASHQFPHIKERVSNSDDTEFFITASNHDLAHLSDNDRRMLSELECGPLSIGEISERTGIAGTCFSLDALISMGYITGIGITPTDVLSASGRYNEYDTEISAVAIRKVCSSIGMTFEVFITESESLVFDGIRSSIIEHLTCARPEESVSDISYSDMLSEGRLTVPIVGVGAPAKAWLPRVAESLCTDLILSENYDVGNAIGAISCPVTAYVEVYIRALHNDFSPDPNCKVFNGEDGFSFKCKKDAMDFALEKGRSLAVSRAVSAGAQDVAVECKIDEILVDVRGNGVRQFRGADITIRASGRPKI